MPAEMTRSKLTAVGMAALLVLSVFASMPVAAQESVSVETLSPLEVTEDRAELQGNLTALDNASNATVWFEYWPENDSANATVTENLTVSSVGTFVIDAEDFESNTTYVAEAHAATGNASAEGGEIAFTTEAKPPLAVSTAAPTNVTNTSATFHGELTRLDGEDSADVWFEYWAQSERTDAETTANQSLGAPGEFTASVDDLEPGTTYFVQAHGEAGNETVAGAAVKFETQTGPMPLGVETNAASAVSNDSATLNGELTGVGGADSGDVWFEWWEQGDSANATTVGNDTLDEPGAFSAGLTGLDNNTTYVYVAHASANNTTVTGAEVEFTTGADGDLATNRTWDGEGPFGQWLTAVLKNLMPADNVPFGQLVSEIVTANNPGSEHRSENANPGGNASGPPEHAGPPGDDANSTDDDDERGPPEHAGPPEDDVDSTDDDDGENGPPDDAGPPEDNESEGDDDEDNGPPDDAGSSDDDDDGENGPPDHAGPPDDDEEQEENDGEDDDSEQESEEDSEEDDGENAEDTEDDEEPDDEDEDDDEEDEDGDDNGNEGGGPPDDAGNGNGKGR